MAEEVIWTLVNWWPELDPEQAKGGQLNRYHCDWQKLI
jgi:hypothetical protein